MHGIISHFTIDRGRFPVACAARNRSFPKTTTGIWLHIKDLIKLDRPHK